MRDPKRAECDFEIDGLAEGGVLMKLHTLKVYIVVVLVGLFVGHFCLAASPQETAPVNPNIAQGPDLSARVKDAESKPTPRTTGGRPDLSGYWTTGFDFLDFAVAKDALAPDGSTKKALAGTETQEHLGNIAAVAARKENKALRPEYKPEFQAKADDNFERAAHLDPSYLCTPLGVPRMGPPAEIVQTPKTVYFLYGNLTSVPNPYRIIPVDGRPHDKDAEPMANGDAVGHWEGDTLVVDVTNFNEDTWLDGDGSFHDSNLHVIERLTRKGNALEYS